MAKEFLDKAGLTYLWGKIKGKFLSLSGGTLTGKLDTASNKYYEADSTYGIDMNNSDLIGVNGLYFNDATDAGGEGINFPNGSGWDTFKMQNGIPYVKTARQKNTNGDNLQMYFAKPYENGTVNPDIRPLIDQCRANRLAFLPADQIIIETTTDGGETWVDGGFTDAQKAAVFATSGNITIPLLNGAKSTQCGLRVTLTGMKYNVPDGTTETEKYQYWNKDHVINQERYFNVREWWFWINSNNDRMRVTIEAATGANPNTWVNYFNKDFSMMGWSGSDWIRAGSGQTFGGGKTQTTNKWNWRLTFWSEMVPGDTAFRSNTIQSVVTIRCYGDNVWGAPNPLMYRDHMYTWDANQNVTFPAKVTAADGFSGSLTGNASTATTATTATQLSQQTAVTSSTINAFRGNHMRFAQVTLPNVGLSGNDGVLLWIPWSDKYGTQFIFDGANNYVISRHYSNGTWSFWGKFAIENKSSANALLNALDTGSSTPTDNDYYISQYAGGGTTTKTYHRRPVSALWTYIKGKISSVLGLTETTYSGSAAKVNNHTVNSDVPANAKFTDTVPYGFGTVMVGQTAIAASSEEDTFNLIEGDNVELVPQSNGVVIKAAGGDAQINKIFTATSTTAAGTAAKVATLEDATGFSLAAGVRVAVRFQYGNSATTPTLNVNSSGAKNIVYPTSVTANKSGDGASYNSWGAYETIMFTYNGSAWVSETSGLLSYKAYLRADTVGNKAYLAEQDALSGQFSFADFAISGAPSGSYCVVGAIDADGEFPEPVGNGVLELINADRFILFKFHSATTGKSFTRMYDLENEDFTQGEWTEL